MSQVSQIEQDLLAATKLPEKKNEPQQKYLTRLMLATTKLPDVDWEGLSTEAQEWVNSGAEAHKAKDALEDFPDYEEVEDEPADEEADDEADEEVEEEKAPVEAKPKKEEKPVKESYASPAPRKVSACHMIKKIVVKKPKITVAELSEKLKADGLKVSDVTIATLRSDLRDTLRVLNELKMGEFVL